MESITDRKVQPAIPKPDFRLRVAVVDDAEDMRVYLSELLAQVPEVKCVGLFANGEEALAAISVAQPEVLLTDVQMPGLSGIECSKQLKQRFPHLIILVMTGSSDAQTMREAALAGVDDYLRKPLDGESILTRLQFVIV